MDHGVELVARRQRFLKAVAALLVADSAKQSMLLEMGDKAAQRWATARQEAGIRGWATEAEAVQQMASFLGLEGVS